MADEEDPGSIKVTDRRSFDSSGERRPGAERRPDPDPAPPAAGTASQGAAAAPSSPAGGARPASAGAPPATPAAGAGEGRRAGQGSGSAQAARPASGRDDAAPEDFSALAAGLSSSFSLLVARLAQETEIYLGLVPYPGKETPEPDLDAARAMIDVLSMLQEKTRGNLDAEESRLLDDLLYTYRLEFVRRRSGGEGR